jgi:hypothetical protein
MSTPKKVLFIGLGLKQEPESNQIINYNMNLNLDVIPNKGTTTLDDMYTT